MPIYGPAEIVAKSQMDFKLSRVFVIIKLFQFDLMSALYT